jgi:hypothetical protein
MLRLSVSETSASSFSSSGPYPIKQKYAAKGY